jgi:hypothetical protein
LLINKRGECSQGRVHSEASAEEWIGAKQRPLTRGAAKPLQKKEGYICHQNQWLPERQEPCLVLKNTGINGRDLEGF